MKLKHKYGAKKCERDEIKFPSKLERACYDRLNLLKKIGDILFFIRQVPFDIPGARKHVVDYCIFTKENVLFIESKGKDLPMGKLKREQVEALFPIKIHTVRKASEIDEVVRSHG